MTVQLIWGCNPAKQFEQAWVQSLLQPSLVRRDGTVLVESGLLRLERSPSLQRIQQQYKLRQQRIAALEDRRPFTVVHLSDEEGLDGDDLYAQLPATCQIWRNFPHPRLRSDSRVSSFPIGPRDLFLVKDDLMAGIPSSNRVLSPGHSWVLYGPQALAQWLSPIFCGVSPRASFTAVRVLVWACPWLQYRQRLMQSVFALAPEGDRHLDTFRLWESLCCGCIPLVVDHDSSAEALPRSCLPCSCVRMLA